jgi:hypothetical protein
MHAGRGCADAGEMEVVEGGWIRLLTERASFKYWPAPASVPPARSCCCSSIMLVAGPEAQAMRHQALGTLRRLRVIRLGSSKTVQAALVLRHGRVAAALHIGRPRRLGVAAAADRSGEMIQTPPRASHGRHLRRGPCRRTWAGAGAAKGLAGAEYRRRGSVMRPHGGPLGALRCMLGAPEIARHAAAQQQHQMQMRP